MGDLEIWMPRCAIVLPLEIYFKLARDNAAAVELLLTFTRCDAAVCAEQKMEKEVNAV